MWRALAKGAGLLGFGRVPGGASLYRWATREVMGTKATHIDKLRRVLPGYLEVWQGRCGLRLEGLRVWVHEAGWTPYSALANYLVTGEAGVLTNSGARFLDRYLARAVNGALATELPEGLVRAERRQRVAALRWMHDVREAVARLGGRLHTGVDPAAPPLEPRSVDLVHSGGALEHYPPARLRAFLRACRRILRPGGVMSHVFDHRDHLHHADPRLPFLFHLALPDRAYRLLCGHQLLYHNRLPPAEIAAGFAGAGFECVAVRRMVLPAHRYLPDAEAVAARPGLPRGLLARRFRRISDLDLRTAAAHYLYRNPG
jgi:SAM-dependent methyltransferase